MLHSSLFGERALPKRLRVNSRTEKRCPGKGPVLVLVSLIHRKNPNSQLVKLLAMRNLEEIKVGHGHLISRERARQSMILFSIEYLRLEVQSPINRPFEFVSVS